MKPFFVYLLECSDSSYYCGHTDDLGSRIQQHSLGLQGYTATRLPVILRWQGEFETRDQALQFEQQIKGWSRAKKEAMMLGDWPEIQKLSKAKTNSAKPTPVRAELVEAAHTLRQAQGERWESLAVVESTGMAQRRAMSKAITLLESSRADHRTQADELLTALLPHTGNSLRIGISGVPGVGKSTFIEALGLYLISQGHRVAVLAVDPSSSISGGSILGDKTRMEKLSVHEKAFIRPSPSSGTLGGVASTTREAMLVCEAAGYDIVIVETVGVGQSETAVAGMTDAFVLMQLPNAGDDLQAIKRGVMELADFVLINKADLDPDAATRAQAQITSNLRIFENHRRDPHNTEHQRNATERVMQLSALKGTGVEQFWQVLQAHFKQQQKTHQFEERRRLQAVSWMHERIAAGLQQQFKARVGSKLQELTEQVAHGELAASTAARQLLELKNT